MNTTRLTGVDALRGVAALGVLSYHATNRMSAMDVPGAPRWVGYALMVPFSHGYLGVTLFIVISGFCIHRRWAASRASGIDVPVDFVSFWRRRITRLYPPYVAAMAVFLAMLAATGQLTSWGPSWTAWNIGLHLTMLHNFDYRVCHSIADVLWSLAVEEQLYLAYFLLLMVRRRLGWAVVLTMCMGAKIAWVLGTVALYHFAHITMLPLESAAYQWFVWALGAVAVEASFGLVRVPDWCTRGRNAVVVLAAAFVVSYADQSFDSRSVAHLVAFLAIDPLWGLGFFILLNRVLRMESRWTSALRPTPIVVRLLAGVGAFSYSIYLLHRILVNPSWIAYVQEQGGFSSGAAILLAMTVLAPAALFLAWGFYVLIERPCIRWSKATPSTGVAMPVSFGV